MGRVCTAIPGGIPMSREEAASSMRFSRSTLLKIESAQTRISTLLALLDSHRTLSRLVEGWQSKEGELLQRLADAKEELARLRALPA